MNRIGKGFGGQMPLVLKNPIVGKGGTEERLLNSKIGQLFEGVNNDARPCWTPRRTRRGSTAC